jgi:hypothetical protein
MCRFQAGITPIERKNDVAPKRGRPPKKPAPPAAAAADSGRNILLSESPHKRQLPNVEPHDDNMPVDEEAVEQAAAPLMPPNE